MTERERALLELEIKALNIINENLRDEIVKMHIAASNKRYYNSALNECLKKILEAKSREELNAIRTTMSAHMDVWAQGNK